MSTILENAVASPRVSVLMTVYNGEPYLAAAIDSVLAQSFPDWELILVENGSIDLSPSIVREYNDPRIRVFSMENNVARITALRYAFDQARGEYVAVLDADDIALPERLIKQVNYMDKNPDVALVGSWSQCIDEYNEVFGEHTAPTSHEALQDCLGWVNPIVHSSVMYRKELAIRVGGYPENLVIGHDLGLVLALSQHFKIGMIDEMLCQLRVSSRSMSKSPEHQVVIANEALILFQSAANTLLLSKKARQLNRLTVGISQIKLGVANLKTNSFLSGVVMVLCGLAKNPAVLWGRGRTPNLLTKNID